MAAVGAGYSGTPLVRKLGFKPGMTVAFIALPDSLADLAASADFAVCDRFPSWEALRAAKETYDAIHAFTSVRAEIENELSGLQDRITPDGMIWVSWPKKASKVRTDVTEDVVRNAALGLDLVDVKVAAIDVIWSGLKLVIRKDRRKERTDRSYG
ncbi:MULTISPECIES: hypothetical protein [unclassified Rhizobium]|uniref:hypothetical protein n=1 Tax=unclassified Rhizobium TaxID=2613769 RepID=UPI0007141586|nr:MULTISPECIES: hypothetical protein [unclassified Rhizobium]KQS83934.1 hypothetical protein ASG50_11080 [Rhizobium sp. Leaf386]KQT05038.1 hypothetical protein ASG42_22770 [Rhizobium sp. Leaf391]KQU08874.1 hypothetical protein ASG68_21725 [Rhizobium sp. Leaf453]